MADDAPRIAVEVIGSKKESRAGHWSFSWRVRNLTDQPIRFLAASCPHDKFKSEERRFDPALDSAARAQANIGMSVRCDEPAGTAVENAFLILLAEWLQVRWRIFVRLRVTIDRKGRPAPLTESITTQRAGFSSVNKEV